MRPRLSRRTVDARVHPAAIVLLALAVSAALFFIVTKPRLQPAMPESTVSVPSPAAPPAPVVMPAPAPAAPKTPPPAPPADRFGFARPLDLGREMARSLATADFERAGRLASVADPAQARQMAELFQNLARDLKVKIGREDQVELLGLVADKTRLALPLTVPGHDQPLRLELDLERDAKMGWKITSLQLPRELALALPEPAPTEAAAVNPTSAARPAALTAPLVRVEAHPDALSFASEFVRVLLRHDFSAARRLVDESKVTPQRLAGLCIVFEEGRYEMKPERPLIVTVANPEVAWVIAQVQSPSLGQSTEFGLELQRTGSDGPWQVKGLNLSEILGSFAASVGKLGVPYTPIVKNPRGGESLALYFEYDRAELHPRALKQLEIVAGLLKSDTSRKLRIAGHTDAKGTENYNIQLSRARAEAVKRGLASLGVSAEQIVTTGLGTAQPLGPNQKADGSDNPEGRSRNRRAEIFLDF